MHADRTEDDKDDMYDLIIIGGGPAGINAGIYAVRRELRTLIIESKMLGGTVNLASNIENYLGFKKVTGTELAQKFAEHMEHAGVHYVIAQVVKAEKIKEDKKNLFAIHTHDGKKYVSKVVIIATGTQHRALGVPGEQQFAGKGVSYCATCDAPLYRDKVVGVVGGGDTALRAVELLSDTASKVYLIHRREGFRAEDLLVKKMRKRANVEFLLNKIVIEIIGKQFVEGVKIKDTITGQTTTIDLDGLFIQIGEIPSYKLAQDLGVETDERNYIKIKDRLTMETNVPGVYAAGDVAGTLAQITNAAADGAIAAMSAYRFIKEYHRD